MLTVVTTVTLTTTANTVTFVIMFTLANAANRLRVVVLLMKLDSEVRVGKVRLVRFRLE
jgi:hypothetical protein